MTPVLNVENICKKYVTKNGVVCANDNISFSLGQNEILAVLGPNGAGIVSGGKIIILQRIYYKFFAGYRIL